MNLKNEILNLYEVSKNLFNDYYNGKNEYTGDDIIKIHELILKAKESVDNIHCIIITNVFKNY